jgi:hypothetical protein
MKNGINSRINKEIVTIQKNNDNKMRSIKESLYSIFNSSHCHNQPKDMNDKGVCDDSRDSSTFLIITKHKLSNKSINDIGIVKPIAPVAPNALIKEENKDDKKETKK